ncbi:MAG TPA: xanthine dehydrogenase molybdopterin binding subunit [Casimicrobiaceae bacterium]|nr:xanthine dehydrogenase molybdopterin binding subunit [Casimicrobiaceae bacterium]
MNRAQPPSPVIGAARAHDSAHLHVAGEAAYVDDIVEPRGMLHAALGKSDKAHARVLGLDLAAVRAAPGVVAVLTAAEIPGINDVGPIIHDEPILADSLVQYVGQPMFAVAATTVNAARRAARLARVAYDPLPAVLTIDDALAAQSFVLPTERLVRGDAAAALASAPRRLSGRFRCGGQDHFYLEGQISLAVPKEDGGMLVHCSTQHPGEIQLEVAHALGVPAHRVSVECRRMGGAFGGKETQAGLYACVAALLASATGRAVKMRVDRDDDMIQTGKRHAFRYDYDVGFDDTGRILGLELALASRCGFSADLSGPVNDRAMFHVDNCYFLENLALTSYRCRTNTVSDTAFRGFGGPQGMFAVEYILEEIAQHLGKDPFDVRRANFYGEAPRDETPYRMKVEDNVMPELSARLAQSSRYRERRAEIAEWNRSSPILRRGLALTPVKFGISFTATHYNQAGALVNLYTDGTVLLNHGGTEMGQGLYTKVAQVVAQELGVTLDRVRVSAADTSKVPNASATAASSGSDMNGMAARSAARTLRERLTAVAAEHFGVAATNVLFADNRVAAGGRTLPLADLTVLAHRKRVSLSAAGFYATPKIHYDRKTFTGRPFFYFAYGAAVTEVVIDTLTGENRLLAVDVLHDVGASLNPALDRGQLEGGFLQGAGWLTMEELWWNERGELGTHSPSTYKIPACRDWPERFSFEWFGEPNREETIHGSKAIGEPPLMLALSVFHALRAAVASVADGRLSPRLDAPATNEAILLAVQEIAKRAAQPESRGSRALPAEQR